MTISLQEKRMFSFLTALYHNVGSGKLSLSLVETPFSCQNSLFSIDQFYETCQCNVLKLEESNKMISSLSFSCVCYFLKVREILSSVKINIVPRLKMQSGAIEIRATSLTKAGLFYKQLIKKFIF